MSNFIVVGPRGNISATCHAVFGQIYQGNIPNAHWVSSQIPTGLAGKIYYLLLKRKLRKVLPPQVRLLWEVKYKDIAPHITKGEDNYIVFCPATNALERISPMLLRDLRKYSPECKLILYLIDGMNSIARVSGVSVEKLQEFFKNFDAVYSYDRLESEKFSLPFVEIPIWISHSKPVKEVGKELYFCGRDKKRSGFLLEIYDRVTNAGLRCDFRLEDTGEPYYRRENIHYAPWTTYNKIVDEVLDANCILEVLAANNFGATLRYKEAVIYNKKLLTNNPEITHLPYYDARWMRYFEKAEDIDLEWLARVEDVDYGYKGDFSAEYFLKTIEETYKQIRN